MDDAAWQSIEPIMHFEQFQPVYGAKPSFSTEVRIAYDNHAIYILAHMFDPHPDSILRQLGLRDDDNMNADMFSVSFDTYNNQLDAYSFIVTAAGVQLDKRESDETYNAVWESEVSITSTGWIAELKIPYSALRFPRISNQTWGMQMIRSIRRYREFDQWSLELQEADNILPYWGKLQGIHDIEPPVRLSATPYLLLQAEHYPDTVPGSNLSTAFGGGLDIKYGMNESFTFDMSLLPDFSQVQSDNKIKNLSAFETVYGEQRPFFNEAVDLFMKGDIFYSRRIGKTPSGFSNVGDSLKTGDHITKNPVQQRIMNAIKVSGRNKHGLAIGFLNAITANTYATITDSSGLNRQILTDPFTNYNLLVFDQALKNNSDFYLINTNVLRNNHYNNANVTAAGLTLNDKSNSYRIGFSGGMSQIIQHSASVPNENNKRGFKYGILAAKSNGNFQWKLSRTSMDNAFDANDMGLTQYNDYNINTASVSYNIYKPFWKLRNMSNTFELTNRNNFSTHKPETDQYKYNMALNTMHYLTVWFGAGRLFAETYDYYEPRKEGVFYMRPKTTWMNLGFSSDYRKTLALDGTFGVYYSARDVTKGLSAVISPIVRFNDHFLLTLVFSFYNNLNDFGYVDTFNNDIIFGSRKIETYENELRGKYLFRNNLSLSIVARHYYSHGTYNGYYTLMSNGYLEEQKSYTKNNDFAFNTFNMDMLFSWIFAPGSSFNLVWKNEITNEQIINHIDYFDNLNHTFQQPQLNNLSLKVLYYFDYQNLKKDKPVD